MWQVPRWFLKLTLESELEYLPGRVMPMLLSNIRNWTPRKPVHWTQVIILLAKGWPFWEFATSYLPKSMCTFINASKTHLCFTVYTLHHEGALLPARKVDSTLSEWGMLSNHAKSALENANFSKSAGTGRLKFNWSNISSFCFTPGFMRKAKDSLDKTGQFHIAKKQIPSILGPVQVRPVLSHMQLDSVDLLRTLLAVILDRITIYTAFLSGGD